MNIMCFQYKFSEALFVMFMKYSSPRKTLWFISLSKFKLVDLFELSSYLKMRPFAMSTNNVL